MYRDNSLIPSETVRLAALGFLTEGRRSYAELASDVRFLSARLVGPSLDLLGPSIELLKVEELAVPDGDGLLAISERGRAELKRLLKATLRGPIGEVNKLIIALKLRFLDALDREDQILQVEMLAETFEQELTRLSDLRGHLAENAGLLLDWLDHDIAQLGERIAWFQALLARLEAAQEEATARASE
jgi:Putative AphA-like transcriptional regulator